MTDFIFRHEKTDPVGSVFPCSFASFSSEHLNPIRKLSMFISKIKTRIEQSMRVSFSSDSSSGGLLLDPTSSFPFILRCANSWFLRCPTSFSSPPAIRIGDKHDPQSIQRNPYHVSYRYKANAKCKIHNITSFRQNSQKQN